MNILQLCTKIPYPPKDGGSNAIFAISKGLARLGHSVTILAVNPPKHFIDIGNIQIPEGIKIIAVNIDTTPNPFDLILNLLFTGKPYHITRFCNRKIKEKLIEILGSEHFDIIQFEGVYTAGLLPVILKYSKAKVSFREHNLEYKLWSDISLASSNILKRTYLKIQAARLKKFETTILRKVDCILPISETDQSYIAHFSSVKCLTIPYCIELQPEVTSQTHSVKKDIFFLGALDWLPNQEGITWFIRKVCPMLLTEIPGLKIHIAGRNAPKNMRQRMQKSSNIIYHGEIDDARHFMQSYKVMIAPLFTGGGMRVKIIDALSLKVPVICSAKAIEGTSLVHDKHVLVARNENEFVNYIDKLLTNPELFNRLSVEGFQYIYNNFNSIYWSKQLVNFFVSNQ